MSGWILVNVASLYREGARNSLKGSVGERVDAVFAHLNVFSVPKFVIALERLD